jgi:hypothetical protein
MSGVTIRKTAKKDGSPNCRREWEPPNPVPTASRIGSYRFYFHSYDCGEPLYAAMGRTEAGRSLLVSFVRKTSGEALIISARDATKKERKNYGKG